METEIQTETTIERIMRRADYLFYLARSWTRATALYPLAIYLYKYRGVAFEVMPFVLRLSYRRFHGFPDMPYVYTPRDFRMARARLAFEDAQQPDILH